MGFLKTVAYETGRFAGESKRRRESEQAVRQQDPQTAAFIQNLRASAQAGNVNAMATNERDCCRCVYAKRDPGSNSGWYCEYHRTHIRPGRDECGYFKDSGRYK